jgi:hypothetical protein
MSNLMPRLEWKSKRKRKRERERDRETERERKIAETLSRPSTSLKLHSQS